MTAETSNSAGKTLARTAKGSHRINAIRIKSGANSLGVRLALDVVWPSGVPEGLRAKDRNKAVHKWLKDNNKSILGDIAKAVQRALKRT